jgi:hypothetical protein
VIAIFSAAGKSRATVVDARIAAAYHRHHHTVVMSCPSYVTPACDGAYIELALGGTVYWEESFRINPGQSVPFTFANLTDATSQALDLAKPTLRCKYGKALSGIPATVALLLHLGPPNIPRRLSAAGEALA